MKFSTFPWWFCHSQRHAAPPPHTPSQRPFLIWICVLCFCYCGGKKWIVLFGSRQRAGADLLHFYIHKMFAFLLIKFFFLILVLKLHRTQENKKKNLEILRSSVVLTSVTPLGSLVPVLLEVIEGPAGAYRTRGLLGYPLYAGTHLSSPCFSLLPSRGSQLPTGAT